MMTRFRGRTIRTGGYYVGYDKVYQAPISTQLFYTPLFNLAQSCYDELHRGPPYRSGGPLSIIKREAYQRLSANYYADETFYPHRVSTRFYMPALTHPAFPNEANYAALGPEAWARSLPGSPVLNLANSLFELKDMPRMIIQTRAFFKRMSELRAKFKPSGSGLSVGDALKAGDPGAVGSDYLNLEFGWLPMLNDLWNILGFQKKIAKKVAYLKRHNRKVVHVRKELRGSSYSTNVSNITYAGSVILGPAVYASLYSSSQGNATSITTYKYKRRAWFSAAFQFYIPELEEPMPNLNGLKLNLLGLSLDPAVIYHAVPWTWLVDWFTPIGKTIDNAVKMSRFHVVAKYAYVMNSEMHSYTDTGFQHMKVGKFRITDVPGPPVHKFSASTEIRRIYKSRTVAKPYGFGIADSSLSGYQWSILAALGLSRL